MTNSTFDKFEAGTMNVNDNKTLIAMTAIVCTTILVATGLFSCITFHRNRQQVKINAQKEVERTRIEQEAKSERTKERLKALPWYKPLK